MKISRILAKTLMWIVIVALVAFAGLIIYAVATDYKPKEKEVITVNDTQGVLPDSATITLLTWNIGYCGLDKQMDFFYDGGTKVFTPKETMVKNLMSVISFLKKNDSVDFILLQEVDRKSKRSYDVDQHDAITAHLPYNSKLFATNYDVFFVPLPVSSPMGHVYSGLTIMSKAEPSSSIRYAFPGKYGFPKQLFMLDRCFIVNRYPMSNGKELVLINTHNEAFDPGDIRKAQMEYLRKFISDEYGKGNYVIAGGDWNQCPPSFTPAFANNKVNTDQMVIPSDFMGSDWKWVYDPQVPSNRSVVAAYDPATTTTTVIDFFLLSPNIKSISVSCVDLGFEYSDHNPVKIKVQL
ncbi:MAG: hypothetical protein U0X39_03350 [Bacteroidales bacterium]